MGRSTAPLTQSKIKTLQEIELILDKERRKGVKIVQCHGVFDLLHPGHVRHFKIAKAQGDRLVVTVTPDRFVNKGPGRPAFPEPLRLEVLAALSDVDYVVLNDTPDAVSAIRRLRPSVYVKGIEYADHAKDVTGKISEEVKAVEEAGGVVFYTDDIVFSSSSLLNRYFDAVTPEMSAFLNKVKASISLEEILEKIEALSSLHVLVVGDAILDEYQYVSPLGQSGKGLHMVARCLEKEVFLGGSLIIANHLAQFTPNVTLLAALGKECPYAGFVKTNLDPKVKSEFLYVEETSSLVKKRYVLKDGKTLSKLFETYQGQEKGLSWRELHRAVHFIEQKAKEYDLILVADFGNGFTNSLLIDALSNAPTFLALNAQLNSGNRGFHVVTHYGRADYISANEPEIRLAAHDQSSRLEGIVSDLSDILHCPSISVTRGVAGVSCFSKENPPLHIPAFATHSVDRIGAGDCYFSLSSLCLAKKEPLLLAGFLGSLAAAMSVQIVGNQEAIKKSALCKFLTRLMK